MKKSSLILLILMFLPIVNAINLSPGSNYTFDYNEENISKSVSFYCEERQCGELTCGNVDLKCPDIPQCPESQKCPDVTCEQNVDYVNLIIGILIILIIIGSFLLFFIKERRNIQEKEISKEITKNSLIKNNQIPKIQIPEGMTMQEYIEWCEKTKPLENSNKSLNKITSLNS